MKELDTENTILKNVSPWIWFGLPFLSLSFCCGVAIFGGAQEYFKLVSASESAYLEYSMPVLLLPSVLMAGWLLRHHKKFPGRWTRVLILLLFLGSLYFLGEETSWGQHYFHWETPEWIAKVSDQGETNIHNVNGIFDQFPRALLTAAAIAAFIFPFLLVPQRKKWNPRISGLFWMWPTVVSAPAGLVAALSGLPQKFYGKYGSWDPSIPEWFDCMFLRGQHSELMEHFLAMFIFMYILSLTWRFRQFLTSLPLQKPVK